jgi:hypothetical protein
MVNLTIIDSTTVVTNPARDRIWRLLRPSGARRLIGLNHPAYAEGCILPPLRGLVLRSAAVPPTAGANSRPALKP